MRSSTWRPLGGCWQRPARGCRHRCQRRRRPAYPGLSRPQAYARAQRWRALGRKLFFDPSLSASGKWPARPATIPHHAFGPPNALRGAAGRRRHAAAGLRAVPSLKYLQAVPPSPSISSIPEDEGDESVDNGPTGGLTWDGRVDRGRDQARIPLLVRLRDGQRSDDRCRRAGVRKAGYGDEHRGALSAQACSTDPAGLRRRGRGARGLRAGLPRLLSLSAASTTPSSPARRTLTRAGSARALRCSRTPDKGNCASCHLSQRGNDGTPPQFTDYGLIALGVPRNPAIPANADPDYFDLGLCGPLRTDLAGRDDYCGLFRTPTLRNVALRKTFFHNGVFHTLREAVAFYVERDTDPGNWYPRGADGSVASSTTCRSNIRPTSTWTRPSAACRRPAGADLGGDRRCRGVPQHADRRIHAAVEVRPVAKAVSAFSRAASPSIPAACRSRARSRARAARRIARAPCRRGNSSGRRTLFGIVVVLVARAVADLLHQLGRRIEDMRRRHQRAGAPWRRACAAPKAV